LKYQRQLVAETPKMKYIGKNYSVTSREDNNTYFIGVHNKTTRQVQLVPISHIFMMEQFLKNYKGDKEVEDRKFTSLDRYQSRQVLINNFASKKQQNSMLKHHQNTIKEDNTIGMQSHVNQQLDKLNEEKSPAVSVVRPDLPTYNEKATKVKDIYNINSIITSREMDLMEGHTEFFDVAKEVVEKGDDSLLEQLGKDVPSFVMERFKFLCNSNKGKKELETTCRNLQYLTYLINFFKASGGHHQWAPLRFEEYQRTTNIPLTVLRAIAERFTRVTDKKNNKKRYQVTLQSKLKVVRHICVMCLLLGASFTVHPAVLSKDLFLPLNVMKVHLKNVGCSLIIPTGKEKKGEPVVAVLKVPLTFPTPKRWRT